MPMTKGCGGEEVFWISALFAVNRPSANSSNKLVFMEDLSMAILTRNGNVPCIRDEPISRVDDSRWLRRWSES